MLSALPLVVAAADAQAPAAAGSTPEATDAIRPDFSTDTYFKLREDEAKLRRLAMQAEPAEASPLPSRARGASSPIELGADDDTDRPHTPFSIECKANTCTAFDGLGRQLFRRDRDQVRNADPGGPLVKVECLSAANLLTTFDRQDRCNGVGRLLPTPWDPLNDVVPKSDRP